MLEFEARFYDKDGDRFYSITPCMKGKIWISAGDGEGGSFDAELIYNLIHQYFRKNF